MTVKDHYKTLEVGYEATQDDIKRAYRKKAMQFHPDRAPAEAKAEYETKFKEVAEAYEVLSDPPKKREYDLRRTGRGTGPIPDIFSEPHYNGGKHPTKGRDIQLILPITLEEIAEGVTKTIEYARQVTCEQCKSEGLAPGRQLSPCPTCRATGFIDMIRMDGRMRIRQTCGACMGTGRYVNASDACQHCGGAGRVNASERLDVMVPLGATQGQAVIFENVGHAGFYGGPFGNVIVFFQIESHKRFNRANDNLFLEHEVSMTTLLLGGVTEVTSLRGKTIKLTIPPETKPGTVLRVDGQGLPNSRTGNVGDMMVSLSMAFPQAMTEKQRELLREFEQLQTQKQGETNAQQKD